MHVLLPGLVSGVWFFAAQSGQKVTPRHVPLAFWVEDSPFASRSSPPSSAGPAPSSESPSLSCPEPFCPVTAGTSSLLVGSWAAPKARWGRCFGPHSIVNPADVSAAPMVSDGLVLNAAEAGGTVRTLLLTSAVTRLSFACSQQAPRVTDAAEGSRGGSSLVCKGLCCCRGCFPKTRGACLSEPREKLLP